MPSVGDGVSATTAAGGRPGSDRDAPVVAGAGTGGRTGDRVSAPEDGVVAPADGFGGAMDEGKGVSVIIGADGMESLAPPSRTPGSGAFAFCAWAGATRKRIAIVAADGKDPVISRLSSTEAARKRTLHESSNGADGSSIAAILVHEPTIEGWAQDFPDVDERGTRGKTGTPGFERKVGRMRHPVIGYARSAAVASVFYILWLAGTLSLASPGEPPSLASALGFAAFLYIVGGFGPALGLMIVPWVLAVRGYRLARLPGWLYYTAVGAVGLVALGCAASSLAPKPLFVDDQTFLEGVVIAAERQGVCLALAGMLFGLTYWFSSGRRSLG